MNPHREVGLALRNGTTWFIATCLLAAILTSCSPYVAKPAVVDHPTPAPSRTPTAARMVAVATTTPRPSCTVTAYTLNLRTGAGMSYAVRDVLHKGERLQVIARGAWLKVSTGKVTGFIFGRWCQ